MELPFDYMTFSDTQPLDLALTEYQLTNGEFSLHVPPSIPLLYYRRE